MEILNAGQTASMCLEIMLKNYDTLWEQMCYTWCCDKFSFHFYALWELTYWTPFMYAKLILDYWTVFLYYFYI